MGIRWTKYEVEMVFLTALCGSVPADPNLQKAWLEARLLKKKVVPPDARSIKEIHEEVIETTLHVHPEEDEEGILLLFQRVDGVLAVRAGTVRAHIKDCARRLTEYAIGRVEKTKPFGVRVTNCVYVAKEHYWLPILNQGDGQTLREPTGRREKGIHVNTPRGERNSLKAFEYVDGAMLRVPLVVLSSEHVIPAEPPDKKERVVIKPAVSRDDLEAVFMYGAEHGYGGERSDGEGRYIAEIKEVKNDG